MTERLSLKYTSDVRTARVTGKVVYEYEDPKSAPEMEVVLHNLVEVPFSQALTRFAEAMGAYPNAQGFLCPRYGATPATNPFVIEAEMAELLRTDPITAIRILSPEARHVVVRDASRPVPEKRIHLVERHGRLLVRVRWLEDTARAESPWTARWHDTTIAPDGLPMLHQVVALQGLGMESWRGVYVDDLLSREAPRYWLWDGLQGWAEPADIKQAILEHTYNATEL